MLDDEEIFANKIVWDIGVGDALTFIGRTWEIISPKAACLTKLMPGIGISQSAFLMVFGF